MKMSKVENVSPNVLHVVGSSTMADVDALCSKWTKRAKYEEEEEEDEEEEEEYEKNAARVSPRNRSGNLVIC